MTKLYIVRHCEAMGNVNRIFQGSTDLDISETGAKQLEYLTKRFEDIQIDRLYSSPLIRAKKTALAIAGNRDIPVEINSGLREMHGGIVEGKPFKEVFNSIPGLAETWDNHPEDFAPEGGEPMRDAYERAWETITQLAAENEGKTIVCASHGGIIRCLNCRFLFGDISKLKEMPWSENTAVTLFEFENDSMPKVIYRNDVSHLPEGLINSRSRLSSIFKDDE